MKVKYAVTFEFLEKPPLTTTGVVASSSAGTCAARAVREAQEVLRPVRWTSLVCVLLERLDGGTPDA